MLFFKRRQVSCEIQPTKPILPCNTVRYHMMQCNAMQYHKMQCNSPLVISKLLFLFLNYGRLHEGTPLMCQKVLTHTTVHMWGQRSQRVCWITRLQDLKLGNSKNLLTQRLNDRVLRFQSEKGKFSEPRISLNAFNLSQNCLSVSGSTGVV